VETLQVFYPSILFESISPKEKEEKRELVLSETFGLMKNHTLKTKSEDKHSWIGLSKMTSICEKANQVGANYPDH
jgi:hypothetical protein